MTRTVIIGAGIAGLATAALLAKEGHDVVVLEKNGHVGGRAGTATRGGFRFDTGPSWYLMPEVFEHFFRLLGTTADAVILSIGAVQQIPLARCRGDRALPPG